jgi:farnesol dehydrogenase
MLADRGEIVHLLTRGHVPTQLAHPNIKPFVGEITDENIVRKAISGCDRVIHLAAHARQWSRDPSVFYRVNVEGTGTILGAAALAGVTKFVYTSTASILDIDAAPFVDEGRIILPGSFATEYARSKALAEKEVLSFIERGLPVSIVYPTRVYGPGKLTESNAATRVIALYAKNKFPFLLQGGIQLANWAFVEDVARGHVLALEKGAAGQRYILGGCNVSLTEVFDQVDALTGRKHFRLHTPLWLALALAAAEEVRAYTVGGPPRVTRKWVKALTYTTGYSSARAAEELGYQITPLVEGLGKTLLWLRKMSQD